MSTLLSIHSKFEEAFEEMRGVETPPGLLPASSSGCMQNSAGSTVAEGTKEMEADLGVQNMSMCSDLPSDDFAGGMTKIVPSDVDVSALIVRT